MDNLIEEECFILVADCGDEIEMWIPVSKMVTYCHDCKEIHEYKAY